PGFVKFTTASPITSAAVVTISKKTSALIPMRPTLRSAPAPAIPTTIVENTSGAMIDLIRLMKMSRKKEHTSELQSQSNLVCRLLLEKKKNHVARTTQMML